MSRFALTRWFAVLFASSLALVAPGATWVVTPAGDDANAGDEQHPFKTISRAAEQAMPGDVVLVRAGVYRERVAPPRGGEPGKPITYRAAPGERVFVRGSEPWAPDWRDEGGGVFSAVPDEALFNDRSPEYVDGHNPLKVRLSSTPGSREGLAEAIVRDSGEDRIGECDERVVYTCGQVFVNGEWWPEAPLREELAAGRWWYEAEEDRVHVHFGDLKPADQRIELTTRRRLFAPKKRGLGHIVVEGFVFEHCGNQYPTNFWKVDANAQKGAVGTEAGHHWVIRRNVVRHAKTFAIDVGRVDQHGRRLPVNDNVVEENYIVDNGSAGVLSSGSENLIVRRNVILRNNRLRFLGVKRWEQAGVKCHSFDGGLIEGNYIAENADTYGVWLDNQFPDCRVTRNVLVGNGRAGVFLEMSDYGYERLLVDHNLVIGNYENAVYIHDASGGAFVHNLLANTRDTPGYGQAVFIRQVTERTRSRFHSFYNNLILGNARNIDVNYPALKSGVQRFDGNVYGVGSGDRAFVVNPKSARPSPWSSDDFRELVTDDFGDSPLRSEVRFGEQGAQMPLAAWRRFWKTHDYDNDAASRVAPGASVAYDPQTQRLTLDLPGETRAASPEGPRLVDRDYFGEPILGDGNAAAGPFQSFGGGKKTFQVWHGLPLVGKDELPAEGWTLDIN